MFLKPTVAVYTDGVYWARQAGMNITLFDLEGVEVLQGPQGTLFGKNALGGAINLISKAPQGDNSGMESGNDWGIPSSGSAGFRALRILGSAPKSSPRTATR